VDDEGQVKLDGPVEKFLPEFRGQMYIAEKDAEHRLLRKPRHAITVRNILSHTSGLPFRSEIEVPHLDLWPLALRVRSYAATPLDFDPDTRLARPTRRFPRSGRREPKCVQAGGREGVWPVKA
jgi:CubicO group peptidase (beta-lactamase class C family)